MNRFKNVLVHVSADAVDDPALRRAAELAWRTGAELTLADTFTPVPAWLRSRATQAGAVVPPVILQNRRLRQLEAMAAPLRRQGLWVRSVMLRGEGPEAVLRQVRGGGHDLVMKTARGCGGEPRALGTVARALMRAASVPVWVVGPEHARGPGRVLVALDPCAEAPGQDALCAQTLDLARAMAEADGAQLHVVHAWAPFGTRLVADRAGEASARVHCERAEHAASRELQRALAPLGWTLRHPQVHLKRGPAVEAISAVRESIGADLVVMGMTPRGGIAESVLGNTAEKILQHLRCSVLAVKPGALARSDLHGPAPSVAPRGPNGAGAVGMPQ
jgi:universal stress protein E